MNSLTNFDIENYCKHHQIPTFRGVFMRDTLPPKPLQTELAILNLDSIQNKGTHWTLYFKNNNTCYFYDSYGQDPPAELFAYLKQHIWTSTFVMQDLGTKYCGHLCLILAKLISHTNDFVTALLKLKSHL